MFVHCYSELKNEEEDIAWGKHCLHLEGFLLHARILRDFFINDQRQDDVLAIHFFDDVTVWEDIKQSLCPYLRRHKQRINKYLAHLTYDRLRRDKLWHIDTIYEELVQAWQQFYSSLPQERQALFN